MQVEHVNRLTSMHPGMDARSKPGQGTSSYGFLPAPDMHDGAGGAAAAAARCGGAGPGPGSAYVFLSSMPMDWSLKRAVKFTSPMAFACADEGLQASAAEREWE